eukprot:CAMPEP_0174251642 /NCGR_PEP_ID=MMETSP0439-20130205/1395_1 /TAXON_ID=0 /ORGANISM="Stereomyxa ramosa, Strain Chinc5" /LENGTH=355 /DNA_ID=CAMNT_0015332001 /DNA_START=44 /DNA_END=1111 /DNA_ORIENTATION=+
MYKDSLEDSEALERVISKLEQITQAIESSIPGFVEPKDKGKEDAGIENLEQVLSNLETLAAKINKKYFDSSFAFFPFLPMEIKFNILTFLGCPDVANFSLTSKEMFYLAASDSLWKLRAQTDVPWLQQDFHVKLVSEDLKKLESLKSKEEEPSIAGHIVPWKVIYRNYHIPELVVFDKTVLKQLEEWKTICEKLVSLSQSGLSMYESEYGPVSSLVSLTCQAFTSLRSVLVCHYSSRDFTQDLRDLANKIQGVSRYVMSKRNKTLGGNLLLSVKEGVEAFIWVCCSINEKPTPAAIMQAGLEASTFYCNRILVFNKTNSTSVQQLLIEWVKIWLALLGALVSFAKNHFASRISYF